jgi:iron complex transport system substrate-binding protein
VTANALDHDHPPSAAIDRHIRAALHAGSSIYRLDEPLLRSLAPDLIVTQELCEVCAVAYSAVADAARRLPGDVPVVSLEPLSLDDICATVETVGRLSGHAAEGRTVAAGMRAAVAEMGHLAAPHPPPRVACLEWTDPLMAGGHWVPEMVRRAGGRDVLGTEMAPSGYVGWDDVLRAEPEVMVLMPCGFDLAQTLALAGEVTSRPGFDQLPCARTGRVLAVDGSSYFNRPGPRIVHGLNILAQAMRLEPGAPLLAGAAWVGG